MEVPWRRGTAIHTARRDELLRILVPRQVLPDIEVLHASAARGIRAPIDPAYGGQPSDIERSEHLSWNFSLTLYVTPRTTDLLVLPTHKMVLIFALGSEKPQRAAEFHFVAPYRSVGPTNSVLDSSTVTASQERRFSVALGCCMHVPRTPKSSAAFPQTVILLLR